jgi:hypothetical protein
MGKTENPENGLKGADKNRSVKITANKALFYNFSHPCFEPIGY